MWKALTFGVKPAERVLFEAINRAGKRFDSIAAPTDEPLVIHQHGSISGRALIILVHGLGGSRYHTCFS